MRVNIFSTSKNKDEFIIIWSDCPDYFVNWLVKNFANGNLDYEKHKIDVATAEFTRFCKYFSENICSFRIADFFGIHIADVDRSHERFINGVIADIFKAARRHKIKMITEATYAGLIKFQISENNINLPKPICKQGMFKGKVVYVEKKSIDHGYGKMERWQHDCEYFLNLSIRIFDVPLEYDTITLDIRPEFLEKYNCQRVTEACLKKFEKKNIGKGKGKITMQLHYMESADGWKYNFSIIDKKQIIDQLEF